MYSVFIVDDEEIIREGLRHCLEQQKDRYTVCGEAADGELALPMIQELQPDILITDICMPFIDGLDMIRLVRHFFPNMKIVIISGYDQFEYAQKAISLGVSEYILKPIRASSFCEVIDRVATQIQQEHLRVRAYQGNPVCQHSSQILHALLADGKTALKAVSKAQDQGVSLLAPSYVVLYLSHDHLADSAVKVNVLLDRLLSQRKDVLWCPLGDAEVFLLRGEEAGLEDEAYSLARMLQHELKNVLDLLVTIGIGSQVLRLNDIRYSFQKARQAARTLGAMSDGLIMGINDVRSKGELAIADTALADKLKYAQLDDIDRLVAEYFSAVDTNERQSLLYRYYLMVEMVISCIRMFRQIGLEAPEELLRAQDMDEIVKVVPSLDKTEEFAHTILKSVIIALQGSDKTQYRSVIDQAKSYIGEHYCDTDISLKTVAKHVGFSPNHFSTVFSQEVGMTFIEYLTWFRIEKAKELLDGSGMKVMEIALQVGYSEPNYFSHIFKTRVGVNPREYRQKHRAEAEE